MKSKIFKLELIGALFIIIFGSLLHFTFDWFKNFWLVGIFSAVNESVWEHLKLAVIPAVVWLLIERRFIKIDLPNFTFAKVKGIFLMPILIIVIFYSYKALLGKNYLILDILTFVVAVLMGQLVSFWIMFWPPVKKIYNSISVLLLILLVLSFVVFTFYPPRVFLFQDPISLGYGINLVK
jgi:hypothetical protein